MQKILVKRLRNWANYPEIDAEMAAPFNPEEARSYVLENSDLIARGMGKCYGDAALGRHVLSTLHLNKILHFDAQNGVVECEAGALLSDIIAVCVPQGRFFHVTPGIKEITVGGAIASDVHGKNHPAKGCFSNWLESFELLTGSGEIIRCSKMQHQDLFWQTCGGMGWTGVVLSARFRLMRIVSVGMQQKAVRCEGLHAVFDAFENNRAWPYAAGWIDCLASGKTFGRGVVYLAEHKDSPDASPLKFPEVRTKKVLFYAPSWMLNPLSIRLHNAMLFSGAKTAESEVDMDRYFYPLDRVKDWNKLYGRRGFIQYQFCLPEAQAFDGLVQVLETIKKSSDTPFLSVLKRHGDRLPEAVNTFPEKGYSLALDFPRTRSIFRLVDQLDAVVWNRGGKIYLTKDACSAPHMSRIDPRAFGEDKFMSVLRERLRK